MPAQPLTKKDAKRLKQINQEIGKLTNEAVDILQNDPKAAGFLYISSLDFNGVDGCASGDTSELADMLVSIGTDHSPVCGAILLAALSLSKGLAATKSVVPAGPHTKD